MFTGRCEKCQNPLASCFCGNLRHIKIESKEVLPEDIWNRAKRENIKAFINGAEESKKQVNKTLTDLLNKYKSWLQEEKAPKLGKTISQEKIIDLTARIEVLEELKSKITDNNQL